jgi:hypothetical protein
MTDQQFEELAKRWPDLFQKAEVSSFDIDIGWLSIIDTLCQMISYNVENQKARLKHAMDNPGDNAFIETIPEIETKVKRALEDLPTIIQVKEKYGGLRFYVEGGTKEMADYIDFAEALSLHICEECGSPGEPRNDGWTKTLCERHHRERNEQYQTNAFWKRAQIPDE